MYDDVNPFPSGILKDPQRSEGMKVRDTVLGSTAFVATISPQLLGQLRSIVGPGANVL